VTGACRDFQLIKRRKKMQSNKLFAIGIRIFTSLVFLITIIYPTCSGAIAPDNPTFAVSGEGTIFLTDIEGNLGGVQALAALETDNDDPRPLGIEWSPDGRKLAFHATAKKNTDIYIIGADGKNLKRITDREGEDSWPDWHPGGRRLAITSDRDGNLEIYVISEGGDAIANLTNDPAPDRMPSWSPDGRRIAFASKRGRTLGDIYVMNSDGGNQVNFTNHKGEDIQPEFSHDGDRIGWITRRDGTGNVWVMDAEPGEAGAKNVYEIFSQEEKQDLTWNPDGKEVATIMFAGGSAWIVIYEVKAQAGEGNHENRSNLPVIGDAGAFNRSPAWFDPDFIVEFAVSPAGKQPLSWGWIKQLGSTLSR
jgi:TolB protein